MLSQLTIKNFGLIESISMEFNAHLNILTGETGAGKSILIEALRIALGDRMQTSQLRNPKNPCMIEAIFDLSNSEIRQYDILQDYLSDEEANLIIQRTHHPEGRHKIKINGLSVTVSQLKKIGDYLMDFHGPHDHQMLLSSHSHRGMLDRLINFGNFLTEYENIFKEYQQCQKSINDLHELASSRERELDLLSHQVKELEQAPLDDGLYQELLQETAKINNAEKLNDCASQLITFLEGDSQGVSECVRRSFGPMRNLNQLDEKTLSFMDDLNQFQELNNNLLARLREYAQGLSFQPEEAREINARVDILDIIKRKYGPTLTDAKRFYQQAKEKHDLLLNYERQDNTLNNQLTELKKDLKRAAQKITKQRQKTAVSLEKTIEKELSELGITHVKFEVRIEPIDFHAHGQDNVTFYISPNAGEELKPLAEIVSSGEAARVMLGLKKALIDVDPIGVLIFDEIDAQIGGRLGTVTGKKLREISKNRQVILITHLPQIASFADAHFKVLKSVQNGQALTNVDLLNKSSRVQELSQMMSGEKQSRISVKHAQDMLSLAASE